MKTDDVFLLKNEKISDAEREISRSFVSDVAHELRTPVAVIRGSLEALCDGIITEHEQVEEYHRQMLAESIYLQRLVTDLLEFSRLQSSSFNIVREPVCLSDVVSNVCRSIRQLAEKKNIKLLRTGSPAPYIVNGDYARLRQMMIVVLENAVKFTPEGGSITVSEEESDGKMNITVTDTGCGIPEGEADRIFVKYHRSFSGENRNGTGLGLAIAKEIAERHDAVISVKSKPGEGASFTFSFSECMTEEELRSFE